MSGILGGQCVCVCVKHQRNLTMATISEKKHTHQGGEYTNVQTIAEHRWGIYVRFLSLWAIDHFVVRYIMRGLVHGSCVTCLFNELRNYFLKSYKEAAQGLSYSPKPLEKVYADDAILYCWCCMVTCSASCTYLTRILNAH